MAEGGWALVTGAAGGIGAAICRQLAGQGLSVLMLDRDEAALAAAAERVRAAGGRAEMLVADATAPDAPEEAMARIRALEGRLDALVNVAGGSGPRPVRSIEEMDDALWEHVIALNLTSTFRFCRAAVPEMRARGHGRIVNFSSIVARGRKGPVTTQGARLAYATAKAALLGFTAQLAKDEAPHGITVNALMPSLILAEQGSRIRGRFEALPEAARAVMLRDFPTGRAGEAEEVAAVVGFLCSAAASYVSGVGLPVDGAFL
ncbi:SDR family NAD(P)-dependent oxidoreductase [Siccirubricoccus sp. G192]|uniref:SDR family NAD(P)-dependent oxidoreductase n=1 Tax=Siccirubricoccus sp. G192 TaxID=2849651 RepID=UPI001C2BB330|nr:SDR family NAD(P)-dependent oxidoreductase [Siccirubricoccus sp. G192]MBV1796596.1 SDR family oxidoreductase [Siccirubricoccus sp. G192]